MANKESTPEALLPSSEELTSSSDRLLASRFERSFNHAPTLAANLGKEPSSFCLIFSPGCSERPPPQYPLRNPLPSKVAGQFTNKDTILYRRPNASAVGEQAPVEALHRAVFRRWYPTRPDLKFLEPFSDASVNDGGANAPAKRSKRDSEPMPTEGPARAALQTAFCAPVRVGSSDEMPLDRLIEAHGSLVRRLTEAKDQIRADGLWKKGWSKGYIHLSDYIGSGFCLSEPSTTSNSAQNQDKRTPAVSDTSHHSDWHIRVVGTKEWISRGWPCDDTGCLWEQVSTRDSPKWLTRTMPLEDAIIGVISANGQGAERFVEKPHSEFYRSTFVDPPSVPSAAQLAESARFREAFMVAVSARSGSAQVDTA